MKAVSLFSGAGGFEIGFDRVGIETVLQAESDPHALSVLARHWPEAIRVGDVRNVGASDSADIFERLGSESGGLVYPRWGLRAGSIDVVYGGPPCQDLSVAGKRAGLAGERSGLFFEFARVVSELRPRWLVAENVPGLLSSNQGRDFGIVLDALDELGYGLAWAVLDAQHFGVPQRRRRMFIVGCLRDAARAAKVLSVCEGCGGDPAAGEDEGCNASRRTVGSLDTECGGSKLTTQTVRSGHLISASYWDGSQQADCLDVSALTKQQVLPEKRRFPAVLAGRAVRRLTPRECERLMGWPDDWTRWNADGKEIADIHRYRMCGNGVVAPVAEWIGKRLVAA